MTRYPLNIKPPLSFPTVSGSVCTFNSHYAGLPLKSHTVAVNAVQASGTPSPATPLPISGWSDINITATGKNFLRNTWGGGTIRDVTFTVNTDGSITVNGTSNGVFNGTFIQYFTLPAGTYIYTDAHPENSQCYTYLLKEGDANWYNGNPFTVDGNTRTRVALIFDGNINYDQTLYPMIRPLSIADSTFEAFGQYTTITIGSTVYGVTYDARTGVLTVTHEIVEMSSISYNAGFGGYYTGIYANTIKLPDTAANSDLMCSCFAVGDTAGGDNLYIQPTGTYAGYIIFLPSATYQDANAFRNSLTGQYLVYPLKNPTQTIQLPPCPIDTLANSVNNIWADTGPTELQFPKFG